MNLPTIDEVERSVGGRPKMDNPKVRMSFYLLPKEADKLRCQACSKGLSVSMYVRLMMKKHLK